MLKTNVDKLVKISVSGEIVSPTINRSIYNISADGELSVLPGVGGITYNVRVGDSACGWEADHVEPGISVENKENDPRSGQAANAAFNVLSCVGNEALVVSGSAKGARGVVTGKHGGIDHVLIDFQPEILEKMLIGDRILVRAFGVGLQLPDFPGIKTMNLDPSLLEKLNPITRKDNLELPVAHIIPAVIMGAGLGSVHAYSGDYDIQLHDKKTTRKYGLENLRLGDFLAITDADCSYGRVFRKGAISIGIVVHTNSVSAGHGPGVTTLFTSSKGNIHPKISEGSNIAAVLKLRTDI